MVLSQYTIYCTFVVHCIVPYRTIAVHIYLIAGRRMVGVKGRCTTHGRRKNIPEINHFNIYCSKLMIALQTVGRGGVVGLRKGGGFVGKIF